MVNQLLKRQVKKAFDACGFEIHRKQPLRTALGRTTLAEVLDHISRLGFKPQTVIDVGAAGGTFELYETFRGANHLLVEPLEEWEKALQDICRKFKAEHILAAASDKPGRIVINIHPDHLEGSSIFREAEGSYIDGITREVLAVSIDDLCSERNLRGPYLLKVDVQGAELQVLRGTERVLEDTELIILECSLFEFFVNGPQLYDVVSYMKERGFAVYDIFGGRNRPLDNALAQVDVGFVKEYGQFRKSHSYASRDQRKLMGFRLYHGKADPVAEGPLKRER